MTTQNLTIDVDCAKRAPRNGAPKQLVVLLHGWGADGANLIDLADGFADALPGALFLAPDAPSVCSANPYGYEWFCLMDRQPAKMLAGLRRAEQSLNAFLDAQLAEHGLEDKDLALVGFSQGTMVSLHTALRRPKAMACVVGFSGAMLGAETLGGEVSAKPPVCLIHGKEDEVVPFAAMAHAEAALGSAGVVVETHARPGVGHSIDLPGIAEARGWLGKYLG